MMEHAKKMILVEPRVLEGMTRNQPIEDATNRDLKETSQSMKDILDSDGAAAYDKANAYQQALWGFLKRFEQYKDRPLGKVQLTSDSKLNRTTSTSGGDEPTSQASGVESQEDESGVVRDVLASVPKSLRNKAERLLTRLKANPDVKWNELGELEYGGRVIEQSNLTDLVNDVLRKRKHSADPLGWDVFANALRQVNVAQDLIGNPYRWDYIRKIPADYLGKVTPATVTRRKQSLSPVPSRKKSRRSRYSAFSQRDDDDDDDDDDKDNWSTPLERSRNRDKNPAKKRLTWSTMK